MTLKNYYEQQDLIVLKDPKPGFKVEVLDTLTNTSNSYKSLRAAAQALGVSHGHLAKFDGKLFKGQYPYHY